MIWGEEGNKHSVLGWRCRQERHIGKQEPEGQHTGTEEARGVFWIWCTGWKIDKHRHKGGRANRFVQTLNHFHFSHSYTRRLCKKARRKTDILSYFCRKDRQADTLGASQNIFFQTGPEFSFTGEGKRRMDGGTFWMKRQESTSYFSNAIEEHCTELLLCVILDADAGIGHIYLHWIPLEKRIHIFSSFFFLQSPSAQVLCWLSLCFYKGTP